MASKLTEGWVVHRIGNDDDGGYGEQFIYNRNGGIYKRRGDALRAMRYYEHIGWNMELMHVNLFYEVDNGES